MQLLVAGGDRPAGGSVRIVCGDELRETGQTAAVLSMASQTTDGLIYLEMPTTGARLGPRRLIVFLNAPSDDGARFDVQADCALWAADDAAPLLIAARDGSRHFALAATVLVVRPGVPAVDASAGLKLAGRRLREAAAAVDGLAPEKWRVPLR